MQFQSTLPRRERLFASDGNKLSDGFQSTLPRRERLLFFSLLSELGIISIHAPTKGATRESLMIIQDRCIFQSTLPQRERRDFPAPGVPEYKISIHAPTKGATGCLSFLSISHAISIHAPTKGATSLCSTGTYGRHDFNPRSHEGSDLHRSVPLTSLPGFQSTLPQGATPGSPTVLLLGFDFNPRSHEGSDAYHLHGLLANCGISIHAPTKGATFSVSLFHLLKPISIHAPTKGATQTWPRKYGRNCISIHAPTKGATNFSSPALFLLNNFNPRSHEGSDYGVGAFCFTAIVISIHAPTKGATIWRLAMRKYLKYFNPRSHEGSDSPLPFTVK